MGSTLLTSLAVVVSLLVGICGGRLHGCLQECPTSVLEQVDHATFVGKSGPDGSPFPCPFSKVLFVCDEGYELFGTSEFVCDSSEEWTPHSGVKGVAEVTGKFLPPVCKAKTCPAYKSPAYGHTVPATTVVGESVTMTCDEEGAVATSPGSATCLPDLTWSVPGLACCKGMHVHERLDPTTGRGVCSCNPGFYWYNGSASPVLECEECVEGGVCLGGNVLPISARGFRQDPFGSLKMGKCPGGIQACPEEGDVCGDGYESATRLCSKCAPGFHALRTGKCLRCHGGVAAAASTVVAGVLLLACIIAFHMQTERNPRSFVGEIVAVLAEVGLQAVLVWTGMAPALEMVLFALFAIVWCCLDIFRKMRMQGRATDDRGGDTYARIRTLLRIGFFQVILSAQTTELVLEKFEVEWAPFAFSAQLAHLATTTPTGVFCILSNQSMIGRMLVMIGLLFACCLATVGGGLVSYLLDKRRISKSIAAFQAHPAFHAHLVPLLGEAEVPLDTWLDERGLHADIDSDVVFERKMATVPQRVADGTTTYDAAVRMAFDHTKHAVHSTLHILCEIWSLPMLVMAVRTFRTDVEAGGAGKEFLKSAPWVEVTSSEAVAARVLACAIILAWSVYSFGPWAKARVAALRGRDGALEAWKHHQVMFLEGREEHALIMELRRFGMACLWLLDAESAWSSVFYILYFAAGSVHAFVWAPFEEFGAYLDVAVQMMLVVIVGIGTATVASLKEAEEADAPAAEYNGRLGQNSMQAGVFLIALAHLVFVVLGIFRIRRTTSPPDAAAGMAAGVGGAPPPPPPDPAAGVGGAL